GGPRNRKRSGVVYQLFGTKKSQNSGHYAPPNSAAKPPRTPTPASRNGSRQCEAVGCGRSPGLHWRDGPSKPQPEKLRKWVILPTLSPTRNVRCCFSLSTAEFVALNAMCPNLQSPDLLYVVSRFGRASAAGFLGNSSSFAAAAISSAR